jgi:hypothetical protein
MYYSIHIPINRHPSISWYRYRGEICFLNLSKVGRRFPWTHCGPMGVLGSDAEASASSCESISIPGLRLMTQHSAQVAITYPNSCGDTRGAGSLAFYFGISSGAFLRSEDCMEREVLRESKVVGSTGQWKFRVAKSAMSPICGDSRADVRTLVAVGRVAGERSKYISR